MVHCQKGVGNAEKCAQIADVDPLVVSKNLAIYCNSVRSYGRYTAKIVYIAAPPTELELILKAITVDHHNSHHINHCTQLA